MKVRPTSRGQRIWIEGSKLKAAGFERGLHYTRTITDGLITLRLGDGKLKVAGKGTSPIIDISAKQIGDFVSGEDLDVTYGHSIITIERTH
jgi:hypothetical protein